MSYPLPLAPLPHALSDPDSAVDRPFMQGFVDEAVIDRILANTPAAGRLQPGRTAPVHEDLVLSSGDDDYAGWHGGICPRMAARPTFSLPLSVAAISHQPHPRRATPPEILEPGLDPAYRSGHRWWLAAAAGAVASLVFTAVLVSVSLRATSGEPDYVLRKVLPAPVPTQPTGATQPDSAPAAPREITSRALP